MKTISIPTESTEIQRLIELARQEDLLLQLADGTAFMLTLVDDFDEEIMRTRRNERLMALLESRARQSKTVSLDQVKQQLGLD